MKKDIQHIKSPDSTSFIAIDTSLDGGLGGGAAFSSCHRCQVGRSMGKRIIDVMWCGRVLGLAWRQGRVLLRVVLPVGFSFAVATCNRPMCFSGCYFSLHFQHGHAVWYLLFSVYLSYMYSYMFILVLFNLFFPFFFWVNGWEMGLMLRKLRQPKQWVQENEDSVGVGRAMGAGSTQAVGVQCAMGAGEWRFEQVQCAVGVQCAMGAGEECMQHDFILIRFRFVTWIYYAGF